MKAKSLREAYLHKKQVEEDVLDSILETKFLTVEKLLEENERVKDIGETITHLQEVSMVMKKLTPSFYEYMNLFESRFLKDFEKQEVSLDSLNEMHFVTAFLLSSIVFLIPCLLLDPAENIRASICVPSCMLASISAYLFFTAAATL